MPAKNAKAAAGPSQLGLDFAAEPASGAAEAPAALPAPAWGASFSARAGSGGASALAMACAIQNPKIVMELLALPVEWDLGAIHDDQPEGRAGGRPMTPLAHLVDGRRGAGHWGSHAPAFAMDDLARAALALVERGASFLAMGEDGQCPLTLCAASGRSEAIAALAGHPDFEFAKLRSLRVGPLPLALREGAAPPPAGAKPERDHRKPLLGHLIATCQTKAAEALIRSAGFPANFLDEAGMLPLGYAPNLEAVEALIGMGADPSLPDASGRNALAHAQAVADTSTREKMIARIATELKKGAKADPSIMAKLQSENIAALLEAAQKSPKTSMLKTISAFKFDVANVRDPKTLATPLMAALSGGRMASADHLIKAGCRLGDVDARGVPASAYLLANLGTSNGPKPNELALAHGAKIDLSIRSKRGWPAMLEAASWLGRDPAGLRGYYSHDAALCFRSALSAQGLAKADPSWLLADDGTTAMEAYAMARKPGHQSADPVLQLLELSLDAGCEGAVDGAARAAFAIAGDGADLNSRWGSNYAGTILSSIEKRIAAGEGSPLPRAAAALGANPKLAAAFADGSWPALRAAIEATEIAAAAGGPSAGAQGRKPRL